MVRNNFYTPKILMDLGVKTAKVEYTRDLPEYYEGIDTACEESIGTKNFDDIDVICFPLDKDGKRKENNYYTCTFSDFLEIINQPTVKVELNAKFPPKAMKGYKTAVYGKNKPKDVLTNLKDAYKRML